MRKRLSDYDEALELRLRRMDERFEVVSRMLLGEAMTGQLGLLERQLNDEKKQNDILLVLHDIKKDIRVIKSDIKTLGDDFEDRHQILREEFEWYRNIIRLPTKKKFWVGTVIILAVLVVFSRWTSVAYTMIVDAATKYYHNYVGK